MKCVGEHKIEIEKDEWRNQEIFLVDVSEMHRFDTADPLEKDPHKNHSNQQGYREGSEIFRHNITVMF